MSVAIVSKSRQPRQSWLTQHNPEESKQRNQHTKRRATPPARYVSNKSLRPWGCAIDVEKIGRGIKHPPVAIGIALVDGRGRIRWAIRITRKVLFTLRDGQEAPWTDVGFGEDCWTQWWAKQPALVQQLKQWSLMSRNETVQDMAQEMMTVLDKLRSLPHTRVHWVSDFPSFDETCLDMLVTTYGNQPAEKGIRYLVHKLTGVEFRMPLDDIDMIEWLPTSVQRRISAWADRKYGKHTHDPLDCARYHAGVWSLLQRLRPRIRLAPSTPIKMHSSRITQHKQKAKKGQSKQKQKHRRSSTLLK